MSNVCRETVNGQPCIGVAVKNGLCSVHASGLRQQRPGSELRCGRCRRQIVTGDWYYLSDDGGVQHAKACAEHADVKKEREAEAAKLR